MRKCMFILRLTLVVLMLVFIWGHSMMPADLSDLESSRFLTLVRPLVEAVQRLFESHGYVFTQEHLVRKMAHFTEYAALGVLMCLLFVRTSGQCRLALPAAACLAVAFIDEGIQMFSAGRGPALRDVGLDFCGACAGLLLMALLVTLAYEAARRRRMRPA